LGLYIILKEQERRDKTKEKDLEPVGVANCGKAIYVKLMVDKD